MPWAATSVSFFRCTCYLTVAGRGKLLLVTTRRPAQGWAFVRALAEAKREKNVFSGL